MSEQLSTGADAARLQLYREVVGVLPVPAAVLDLGANPWRVIADSSALRSAVGAEPPAEGWSVDQLFEPVEAVVDAVTAALEGQPPRHTPISLRAPAGGDGWLRVHASEPDGRYVLCIIELSRIAAGLAAEGDADQAMHIDTLQAAVLATDAAHGVLLVSDGGPTFEVAAASADTALDATIEIATDSPAWRLAVQRGNLAWSAGEARQPPLPLAGTPGWEHLCIAGLRLVGRQLALLAVGRPADQPFERGALDRLDLVAGLAATALDHAALVHELESVEQLLRGAVEASAAILEADRPEDVRQELLRRLVDDLHLAGAALWMPAISADGLDLVAAYGIPSSVLARVERLSADSPAALLLRDGGRLARTTARSASSWPECGVRLVRVPPPAAGVLGVYHRRPLPSSVDEVLATLAQALATAVRQTALRQQSRLVLDSLQSTLRPRDVVLPGGVEVGAVCRSATAGAEVGGDVYDWFRTQNGYVGLACGDVSGKGLEAASLAAMAVYTLRAFALQGASPQLVLRMLNQAVHEQTRMERFLTMAYARLDTVSWTGELALAGHPPPLIASPRGVRVLDLPCDVPVGIEREMTFRQTGFALAPDERLVLYTDGVTEARRPGATADEQLGVEGLARVLAELKDAPAQVVADGVADAVARRTGAGTSDDTTVVVLRRLP